MACLCPDLVSVTFYAPPHQILLKLLPVHGILHMYRNTSWEGYAFWYSYVTVYQLFDICLQSGMQAVRENRYIILSKDFEKAYKKAIKKDDQEHDFYK